MNAQQLKKAADTVACIGEHMDMPDTGGTMLAILASKDPNDETQGTVHVVTTDNDPIGLVDSITHAVEQSPELRSLLVKAVARIILDSSHDELSSLYTDPTTSQYWEDMDSTHDEDDDFDETAERERLEAIERRSKIFATFSEKDQVRFWEIEGAVQQHVEADGYAKFIDVLKSVSVSRKVLKRILLEAGCELIGGQGRIYIHAAPSIFRL